MHIIPIICYPISKLLSSLVSLIKHPIWPLLCHMITSLSLSGWWFGTCFIFPFSWECHNPNWTNSIIFQSGIPTRPDINSIPTIRGYPPWFSNGPDACRCGSRSQQRAAEAQDGATLGGQAAAHTGGEAVPGRPKILESKQHGGVV